MTDCYVHLVMCMCMQATTTAYPIIPYPIRMNPKALPRHQLLGSLNLDTREWTDGVLTAAARKVRRNPGALLGPALVYGMALLRLPLSLSSLPFLAHLQPPRSPPNPLMTLLGRAFQDVDHVRLAP